MSLMIEALLMHFIKQIFCFFDKLICTFQNVFDSFFLFTLFRTFKYKISLVSR